MRQEGQISRWVDKRGFGFITNDDGDDSVFLHIKGFETKTRRPNVGDRVTYELASDKDGRLRAENARFVGEDAAYGNTRSGSSNGRSIQGGPVLILTLIFLAAVVGSTAIGRLPYIVGAIFLVVSLITYIAYSVDKSSAQAGRWRIPEINLHVLALVCGWPGALFAQRRLRHKSSKTSFLTVFWITVILNVAAIIYLIWMGEAGHVHQMIEATLANLVARS